MHFETTALQNAAWTLGVNANLPVDIARVGLKLYLMIFMPDLAPRLRRYRYIIYRNHRLRPAVLKVKGNPFYEPLDFRRMHRAAQTLGEKEWSSPRSVRCSAGPNPVAQRYACHASRSLCGGRY